MNSRYFRTYLCIAAILLDSATAVSVGSIAEYGDFAAWQSATDTYSTVDFAGFVPGTIITSQYASLGVLFTDGNDRTTLFGPITYPQDGQGLDGNGRIHLNFSTMMFSIASHFPGAAAFDLYHDDRQIYSSGPFGGGGYNFFGGLVSTEGFNRAVIRDWVDDDVFIDNLYFGRPIPAPSVMATLAVMMGLSNRRRS